MRVQHTTTTQYVSADGRAFDSESDCWAHENTLPRARLYALGKAAEMDRDNPIKPNNSKFWSFEGWLEELDDDAPDDGVIRVEISGKWRDLGTYGEFRALRAAFRDMRGRP